MLGQQVDQALDRAGRLMLVQAELEVHAHHGEVVAGGGQRQVERAGVLLGRFFEQAEDRLGIAEDVGRADEAAHRALHAEHGHLGADRGRGALGVGKLLAGADRAKRNVMGHDQADGRFDLLGRRAQHRAVRRPPRRSRRARRGRSCSS